MHRRLQSRRGMTLPELLVVVAIIGLLAVTVLPVLGGSRQRSQVREATDLLIGHLSEASAKAIGSRNGSSAWYATDATGAGGNQAVNKLGFGRVRAGVAGYATITPVAGKPAAGTLTPQLNAAVSGFLPAPIEFLGIPNLFTATSVTQITGSNAQLNRTAENNAVPNAATPIPYTLYLPPRERITASTAFMPNGMAIDLAWSSIGVTGFSSTAPISLGSTAGTLLAITFDRTGRANRAWYSLNSGTSWNMVTLNSSTPIALLVGPQGNVGNSYVASPTEDDPGANWQNPDARWVLVDPRASVVKSIETYANATGATDSQRFVLQALKNVAAAY